MNHLISSNVLRCILSCAFIFEIAQTDAMVRNSSEKSQRNNYSSNSTSGNNEDNDENKLLAAFTKTTSKPEQSQVIGVIIKNKQAYYITIGQTYFKDTLAETAFDDINFFKQFSKLKSIVFDGVDINDKMMENIYKLIPNTITSLTFDINSISQNAVDVLDKLIKKHSDLLNMLKIRLYKLETDEVEKILSAMLACNNLKVLDFACQEMSEAACKTLGILISKSENLESFAMSCINFINTKKKQSPFINISGILKKKADTLKKLSVNVINLDEENIKALFNVTKNLTKLEELKIYFGNLYEIKGVNLFDHISILANALESLNSLKELNISGLKLDAKELEVVLDSLIKHSKLEILDLSKNSMNEKCATAFVNVLKNNAGISSVNLKDCKIDSKIFSTIASALSIPTITHLSLSNNKIKESAKNLQLKKMDNLRILDLSNNDMKYEDAISVADQTGDTKNLQLINFNDNEEIAALPSYELIVKRNKFEVSRFAKKYSTILFGI